jgi:hypothetical protein
VEGDGSEDRDNNMKVACETVDQFLDNLEYVGPSGLFESTVWVNINRRPLDGSRRDALKFDVTIQASAVIRKDGDEYLLVVGEVCGRDYEDSTQEKTGSARATDLRSKIVEVCGSKGWSVRPGSVSE